MNVFDFMIFKVCSGYVLAVPGGGETSGGTVRVSNLLAVSLGACADAMWSPFL
jgi:hypothetical protein